jgi:hypothetical protein
VHRHSFLSDTTLYHMAHRLTSQAGLGCVAAKLQRPAKVAEAKFAPIGLPIKCITVYILDEQGQLVPGARASERACPVRIAYVYTSSRHPSLPKLHTVDVRRVR